MNSKQPNLSKEDHSPVNSPSSPLTLSENNIYIDEEETYACTECQSNIEIISIDHKQFKITFKCLNNNKNINHNIQTMTLNEFLTKMENNIFLRDKCSICYKEQSSIRNFFPLKYCVNCDQVICNECKEKHFNNNENKHFLINNYERRIKCLKHPENNNIEFCLKCNINLCKECLSSRVHLDHETKSLGHIMPTNKEKKIFQKYFDTLKEKSQKLEKEKNSIKNESNNKLNEIKKQIQTEWEEKAKLEEIKENKELEDIEFQKKVELEKEKREFEERIAEIYKKYNTKENQIKSSHLKTKENLKKFHNEKIIEIKNELSNNKEYQELDKKIHNLKDLILIYNMIKKTQEKYTSNYYNNINFINAISFFKLNLSSQKNESKISYENNTNKLKELKLNNNSQLFNIKKNNSNSTINKDNNNSINLKLQNELEKLKNKYEKLEKENKDLKEKNLSNNKLNELKKNKSNIIDLNESISSTKSKASNKSINSKKNSRINHKNIDFKSPVKKPKENNKDFKSPKKSTEKNIDCRNSKKISDQEFSRKIPSDKKLECKSPKKTSSIDFRSPKKIYSQKNLDLKSPKKQTSHINVDCRSPKKSTKNLDCRSPQKLTKNIDFKSPKKVLTEKNMNCRSPKKISSENNTFKDKKIFDSYSATDIDYGFLVFKSVINENPYIIYSDMKKSIYSYNLKDNKIEHIQPNAHVEPISNFRYCYKNKNKTEYILSISYRNNQIKIWNFKNWEEKIKLIKINERGFLYSACFLKNKKNIYFLTSNWIDTKLAEYIKVYNLKGEQIDFIKDSNENVLFMDTYYDKDIENNYIVTSNKGYIKSYDYNKNKLYKKYQEKIEPDNIFSFIIYKGNDNRLKLLESSYNGIIRLWNFHSGLLQYKFKVESNCIGICLYNKDYILVGCGDKTIKLIKLKDGIVNKTLSGHESKICSIKKIDIPQYGECIFSLGKDNKIRKWKNILNEN